MSASDAVTLMIQFGSLLVSLSSLVVAVVLAITRK
ncbi:MAG: putative holin-like toxin [Alicyclobacillus sp.]|nr:putative holin-like toxin [Alicyclobacillus sp.]